MYDICCDLNNPNKEFLVHVNKIDEEGRYYTVFSIAYELTEIIEDTQPNPGSTEM